MTSTIMKFYENFDYNGSGPDYRYRYRRSSTPISSMIVRFIAGDETTPLGDPWMLREVSSHQKTAKPISRNLFASIARASAAFSQL